MSGVRDGAGHARQHPTDSNLPGPRTSWDPLFWNGGMWLEYGSMSMHESVNSLQHLLLLVPESATWGTMTQGRVTSQALNPKGCPAPLPRLSKKLKSWGAQLNLHKEGPTNNAASSDLVPRHMCDYISEPPRAESKQRGVCQNTVRGRSPRNRPALPKNCAPAHSQTSPPISCDPMPFDPHPKKSPVCPLCPEPGLWPHMCTGRE